jgi:hypothetical protein
MRLHTQTGHARVRINGRTHWLGRFGSPEAQASYDRLLAEYLANGRQVAPKPKAERQEIAPSSPVPEQEAKQASPPAEVQPVTVTNEMTVAEVCVLFMDHAKTYYRLADGRLSSSYDGMLQAVNALRPFGKLSQAGHGKAGGRANQVRKAPATEVCEPSPETHSRTLQVGGQYGTGTSLIMAWVTHGRAIAEG